MKSWRLTSLSFDGVNVKKLQGQALKTLQVTQLLGTRFSKYDVKSALASHLQRTCHRVLMCTCESHNDRALLNTSSDSTEG